MIDTKTVFYKNCKDIKKVTEKIQKGHCPNFFLYGESLCMLEQQSIELSKQLERKHLIRYQGIVKSFTILMPYYETGQEAKKFIDHLNYSLGIARDCYDHFCGAVLIEMESEWAEHGRNSALHFFTDFIRKRSEICFIVLLSGKSDQTESMEIIGRELASAGVWMKIPMITADENTCVLQFCKLAEKKGFHVPERTRQALRNQLEERCETDVDNMEASYILLEQIAFEHSIQTNFSNIIEPEEILCMSGIKEKQEKAKDYPIGFIGELRKKI